MLMNISLAVFWNIFVVMQSFGEKKRTKKKKKKGKKKKKKKRDFFGREKVSLIFIQIVKFRQ